MTHSKTKMAKLNHATFLIHQALTKVSLRGVADLLGALNHHQDQSYFWSMQARRAVLLERETGLQRWAMKLELESVRQVAAAKSLQQQLQKVSAIPVLQLTNTVLVLQKVCAIPVHQEVSTIPVLLRFRGLSAPLQISITICTYHLLLLLTMPSQAA